MLETIDLCKVYKPKKGVPVTALNRISLRFPEKGMVFLLGKSGSGKSTLLNLLGGLDKYDSGEIIIKGVSSKDFKQQYFDSYRNTYVGFIFQEYNILDEFSVGANIALAIELQGRKATDAEINEILKEVDLEGYGNRKPNELSGGQKQRVAIARALVKNPEIIMADEPTGALDSNTGRQIFDTLKKLSRDKLVIIVSHDREFSEQYADRIIELSDGNVISDVELDREGVADTTDGAYGTVGENGAPGSKVDEQSGATLNFDGDFIEIAQGYHLTAEDTEAINRYIDAHPDERVKLNIGKIKAVHKEGHFKDTDQSKIRRQDGSRFKLIKSALPFKSAFKIGASALKYKKFKLVMTILLSVVAFGLFGLSDTMGSYNHVKVCTNSLIDTDVKYVSIVKALKEYYNDGFINKEDWWWASYNTDLTKEQLEEIGEATGIEPIGVYVPIGGSLYVLTDYYDPGVEFSKSGFNIYAEGFNGFAEINEDKLNKLDCKLVAGRLPDGGKDEIAVSEYVFESFKIGGYMPEGAQKADTINKYDDLIGKTICVDGREFTITGIVDTGFNLDRYKTLTEVKLGQSASDQLIEYAMQSEFYIESRYGVAKLLMVGDGYVDGLIADRPDVYKNDGYFSLHSKEEMYVESGSYVCTLDKIDLDKVQWVDGKKTTLGDKEIIITQLDVGYSEVEDDPADYFKNAVFDAIIIPAGAKSYSDRGYKIVGILHDERYESVSVLSDSMIKNFVDERRHGEYSYVVGRMPKERSQIRKLVEYSYDESGEIRYEIQNAVTYELETVDELFNVLSKVFMFVGIGFAVFASLMLANFIGTSISYKKQEIGILRAIGARSNDVFKIFFSESLIIAVINFVISCIVVGILSMVFNMFTRYVAGILISVLDFGPRQVILLLLVSVGVAAAASFIPVKKIAAKKPIDAIRNR